MFLRGRRIFISHASEDDLVATSLVEGLARRGLKAFVDHHPRTGIIPGQDWLDAIGRDIRRSHSVLILISADWRQSPWCQAELRLAKLLKKNVIPVVFGDDRGDDIEPERQKVFTTAEPTEPALAAIARAVPRRLLLTAGIYGGIAAVLALLAAGIEKTPFGRWDAVPLRGGAFVDVAPDPRNADSLFALAAPDWGSRGLFATDDCGAHWTALSLPPDLREPIALDVTREEIIVATDNWVWALNRDTGTWTHLPLEGLSAEVLVAKHVPGRPHKLAYGTRKGGGAHASAGTAAMSSDGSGYRATGAPGGATIIDRRTNQRRSFPFQMNDIAFDPKAPNRVVIAAANDGIFYSRDAMETVHKVESYSGQKPLLVTFDPTGSDVFISAGDGLWTFPFPKNPLDKPTVSRVLDPAGQARHLTILSDGTKLLATTSGIFQSHPNQPGFQPLPPPVEKHVNKVVRCGDRLIAATGSAGVFALSPAAGQWQQVLTSDGNLDAFTGVRFGELELIAAGPYLFRSIDGGRRFDPVLAPGAMATAILFDPPSVQGSQESAVEKRLRSRSESARGSYLYTEGRIVLGLGDGRIFVKPRGSIEWTAVAAHRRRPVTRLAQSAYPAETVVATFADEPPLISTDDARTWKPVPNVPAKGIVAVLAMPGGKFLLGGKTGALHVLDSSGRVVTQTTAGLRPVPCFALESRTGEVFAVDIDGRLYALDDPDLRAREVGRIPLRSRNDWIDLDCCDDRNRMYATVRSDGIFRSANYGKDWVPVLFDGLPHDAKIYEIEPARKGRPAFATSVGYLRPSSKNRLCFSDTSCFSWHASTIVQRIRRRTGRSMTYSQ